MDPVHASTGRYPHQPMSDRDPARADGSGSELTPSNGQLPIADASFPFENLQIPRPLDATPPSRARWLAFGSIIVGGLLGGLIGYGTGDLLGESSVWGGVGALIGATFGAAGVGVVATLTLRAMNEWHAVQHPEADPGSGSIADELARRSQPDE